MKRNLKLIIAAGIAVAVIFEGYLVTRPQKVLGIEYCVSADECQNVVVDSSQIHYLAQVLYGEARGVKSTTEKAAVAWVVLNRVDSSDFPNSVYGVLTQKNQFNGFSESNPDDPELIAIASDVLKRWYREHNGETSVGRVIPDDYYYFCGDGSGEKNNFTRTLNSGLWDWSLESPYED
ncbi:MAG: cell wall hydrolase [Eubacterium sp.]|nr:cell wall hydrolase [Eubacterium sp.]